MRHPFRVFEDNKIVLSDYTEFYFFNKLKSLACGRFAYNGLPREIETFYIEQVLFYNGKGVLFKDDVLNRFAFMKVTLSGEIDIYNTPMERQAFAVTGYLKTFNKNNSVLIKNNPDSMPSAYICKFYAKRLAEIWRTIGVNLRAMRTPVVIASPDDMLLTYQNLGEQLDNNVPVIKVRDTVDLDRIKCLDLGAKSYLRELEEEFVRVKCQALTDLGIDNSAVEKPERLVSSETDGNNGEIALHRATELATRKRAIEAFNRMYGFNATVNYRELDIKAFLREGVDEND